MDFDITIQLYRNKCVQNQLECLSDTIMEGVTINTLIRELEFAHNILRVEFDFVHQNELVSREFKFAQQ